MLPSRRRSSYHLDMVGRIVAGLVIVPAIVIGLVVIAAVFIARDVRVTHSGGSGAVDVETPFGSLRVRGHDNAALARTGLPVYPGAEVSDERGKSATIEFDWGGDHKDFAVAAADYTTSDPIEKVAEFYRDKLPGCVVKDRRGAIHMELNESGYKRIVAIRRKRGRTHIGVASVGQPAAN